MKIEAGVRYIVTRTNSNTETTEEFVVTVTWIEDRGNYYYIGYKPDDIRFGMFGAIKLKKHGQYKVINHTFMAMR